MSRKDDLERRIRDSYDIICQYKDIAHTSDRPDEVRRAEREIDRQWHLIQADFTQYRTLCQRLGRPMAEDIREITITLDTDVWTDKGPALVQRSSEGHHEREIDSLNTQLKTAKEHLLLIKERKAEYVIETSIPLELIKEERRYERQIAELEGQLSTLESEQPTVAQVPEPSLDSHGLSTPNPFGDAGRITAPDRFFGREELMRQIFEELNKGVNLSLVGESQVGKSSLLSMVCTLGPERMDLSAETFAYLNLEWVDNEDDLYEALADALSIEPCRGYKLTRNLRGKRYILCLDEIEKMAWDGFTVRLRSQLRGLADGPAAPLKLVIASRSPLAHLFPDSPELDSPLAGICRQLDVEPFRPDVARAFLSHRLQETGVIFTEDEITTLIAQTGGHPARLQRAAADLYRTKKPGP
jgi:hypothetical protein